MWLANKQWTIEQAVAMKEGGILHLAELGDRLGLPCQFVLEGQERENERSYLGFGEGWVLAGCDQPGGDPLQELRKFIQDWREACVPIQDHAGNGLALASGLVGYFDYEWGLKWQKPAATSVSPEYFFRVCPLNIIWLPQENRLILEVFGSSRVGVERDFCEWQEAIDQVLEALELGKSVSGVRVSQTVKPGDAASPKGTPLQGHPRKDWQGNLSRTAFIQKVERIQEYIKAGDVFQAVLSQRLTLKATCSDWAVYQRLRVLNPSPYLFYVKGKDETLVGSSPELLLSSEGRRAKTRPIAGTRPRGDNEFCDLANEEELRGDVKENAEHAMLVDLGRNDLGRVSQYGSVKVSQYAEVERFSHVMHLVSTVEGELAQAYDGLAALGAVFPAGTLSGAPKVRAMEIIQELECDRRGGYGGALGILRWNGDVDFCITIRTLRFTHDEISVQAGAGIVYDSLPEREYEETLHKAMALMKVVNEVVDGD